MSQSWIFSIFSPSVDDRLRECRRTVESNRRKLLMSQRREQLNAQKAEQCMRRAEAAGHVDQAREYAQQILQARAAEVQLIQTIGRLQELERSLTTSEGVVQMEQVMTDMTQALMQLNNVTPPQRMQHYMMHLERQHQQLDMKREMMYDATESMREGDVTCESAAGSASDIDALRQARASVGAPFASSSSTTLSSVGDDSSTSSALQELEHLSRIAAMDQVVHEQEASLDPASRLVLEAARQREMRQAQAALPHAPRTLNTSLPLIGAPSHTPRI